MLSSFLKEPVAFAPPAQICNVQQACSQDSDCTCGFLPTICAGKPQGKCIQKDLAPAVYPALSFLKSTKTPEITEVIKPTKKEKRKNRQRKPCRGREISKSLNAANKRRKEEIEK